MALAALQAFGALMPIERDRARSRFERARRRRCDGLRGVAVLFALSVLKLARTDPGPHPARAPAVRSAAKRARFRLILSARRSRSRAATRARGPVCQSLTNIGASTPEWEPSRSSRSRSHRSSTVMTRRSSAHCSTASSKISRRSPASRPSLPRSAACHAAWAARRRRRLRAQIRKQPDARLQLGRHRISSTLEHSAARGPRFRGSGFRGPAARRDRQPRVRRSASGSGDPIGKRFRSGRRTIATSRSSDCFATRRITR